MDTWSRPAQSCHMEQQPHTQRDMAFLELQCPKSNALAQRWTFTWNSLERCCGRPDSAKRHTQTLRCAWLPPSPGAHGASHFCDAARLAQRQRCLTPSGERGATGVRSQRAAHLTHVQPQQAPLRRGAEEAPPQAIPAHSPLGRSLLSRSVSLRWLQSGRKTNPGVQTACQQHTRKCFRGNPDPTWGAAPSATCSVATQPCAPAAKLLV